MGPMGTMLLLAMLVLMGKTVLMVVPEAVRTVQEEAVHEIHRYSIGFYHPRD